jgi:hypothetical protein
VVTSPDGIPCTGVYACTRIYDGKMLYYIVNTNRETFCEIMVKTATDTALGSLNLETCEETPLSCLRFALQPTQSLLLLEAKDNSTLECEEAQKPVYETVTLKGDWAVKSVSLNSITLDRCRFAFDDGVWQDEIPVILLQQKLLEGCKNRDVKMEFAVNSTFSPQICDLVLETPEAFEITINGERVNSEPTGWWVDKSFYRITIARYMKAGRNTILLKRHFYLSDKVYRIKNDPTVHEAESNRTTLETELESVYLLGDFCVAIEAGHHFGEHRALFTPGPFTLMPMRETVPLETLVTAGYPFFAGNIKLQREFAWNGYGNVRLTFSRPDAVVTKAWVNGQLVKVFGWAPYEANITALLKAGKNVIAIELVNSLRNLLGPHHNEKGERYGVSPPVFCDIEGKWNDDYCFVRFGIEGGVKLEMY